MGDALLETKFMRPRLRWDNVRRPRLAGLLERAADSPVTLVAAPAGFGKTTLVATWLADLDRPVAWVSLDSADRMPHRFLHYLLTSLDRAVPGSASAALTLAESGQAPAEAVLAGVVNELSVHDGDVTLVLDDLHLAESAEVSAALTFLVEHLPPQLHLVITTRSDPALPLPRLRVRGELTEVRAADLRFDAEEVTAYLNDVHGLDLPRDLVDALGARTEGWAAALQLAALSLRGRADSAAFVEQFAGDDRFVVDYLVEEVLAQQPEDVRRFLLDTSVLDRLSAPLCDAVTGRPGTGRAMLDRLERDNLFVVPLDDRRGWSRYHQLFADVLRAHLQQERPGDVAGLHRRASAWHTGEGEVVDAVRHALVAGDALGAAEIAEAALPRLRRERREAVIRQWADELPPEVVAPRPVLAVGLIGGLMASNEFGGVAERIDAVEAALAGGATLAELDAEDPDELAALPSRVEGYRAALALATGDIAGTLRLAERAIASAPPGDDLTVAAASGLAGLAAWATGDIVSAHASYLTCAAGLERNGHLADVLGTCLTIADMELALGRLGDAERTLARALDLARRHQREGEVLRGTADMLVAQSRLAWHRDDLPAAAELLREADALGESAGLPQNRYRWRVAMARLRAAERDWPAALALLEEAERVYVGDLHPQVHPVHATRARVLAASGDVDGALAWARQHGLGAGDDLSYLSEYPHVTLAHVLLAEHRATGRTGALHDALGLLDRLREAAVAGQRDGSLLEIEVLRGLGLEAAGSRASALQAVDYAVHLASPDGWLRPFLDAPPDLDELLRVVARREPDHGFLDKVMGRRAGGIRPVVGRPADLPDPLSERELEVLRLLGTDLSGPDIARELVVSLHTVRTHTKHIYTKLAVTSRRAAITRAHQLGLLTRRP